MDRRQNQAEALPRIAMKAVAEDGRKDSLPRSLTDDVCSVLGAFAELRNCDSKNLIRRISETTELAWEEEGARRYGPRLDF
jgi:hypothetical protein